MPDEAFLKFALEILDRGGPLAFSGVIIGGVIWYLRKTPPNNQEAQMTAAFRELAAEVRENHKEAQASREEMKDGLSDLGQRVARMEGRMEGK